LILLMVALGGRSPGLAGAPTGAETVASGRPAAVPPMDPTRELELRKERDVHDGTDPGADPTIVGDPPVVGDFIRRLAARGVTATAIDTGGANIEFCLHAPQRGYDVDGGLLHVFLFTNEQAAKDAAARFPPDADCGPMDWAEDVRYFRDGELIVFLVSQDARVLKAVQDLCGPPFAVRKRQF
jgi:hypothetical protein